MSNDKGDHDELAASQSRGIARIPPDLVRRGLELVPSNQGVSATERRQAGLDAVVTDAERRLSEIARKIRRLDKLNSLRDEEIVTLVVGRSKYHKEITSFFRRFASYEFWVEWGYWDRMDELWEREVETLDLDEIRGLLTHIWRMDRFVEGLWAGSVRDGTTKRIQIRLEELYSAELDEPPDLTVRP